MPKSFFSEQECRNVGFSEPMIRTLKQLADFVNTQAELVAAQAAIAATDATVVTLDGTIAAADAAITVLDSRVDAYDALAPFVRQDQGPAWTAPAATVSRGALAAYTAPTISNPPTQGEVQAIATQLAAVTGAVAGVITDGQSNGSLT